MSKKQTIWQKNLQAMKKANSELAKKLVDDKKEHEWIEKIRSKNNDPNILVRQGGEIFPAYDMDNPSKESENAASNMVLHKQNVSVIIGIGVGHLTNAILKKCEKGHRIIVGEPITELIKIALKNFDFSKAILKKELIIVTSSEQMALVLQVVAAEFVVEGWMMTTDKYTTRRQEYSQMISISGEVLNQILCNTGTVAGAAGGIIADNDVSCMPYVIRHRGVAELKDVFKDKPAILVSTGPSLAKNIHHLMDIKDNAVIIAVGQALRPLLAYDIKPDFITTVDFGVTNFDHYKNLLDSDVPLVTINRKYAPLLKAWQGPKFIAATPVPGYENMATGILTNKGFVEAGGSVAHMSFGLAQLLGCNPIIFVGQDLALGEKSHIPLADAMGKVGITQDGQILWKVEDHRCELSKESSIGMGPVHTVPGYYGEDVFTNLGLASFLTVFEDMVRRHKENNEKIVVNSTEGGAKIRGCIQLPLREAIEKYCIKPIDKKFFKPLLTLADDGDELVSKVIPLLKHDIDILKSIIKNSKRGLTINKIISEKLEEISKKGKKIITKKHEKLFDKIIKEVVSKTKGNFVDANFMFYDKLLQHFRKRDDLRVLIQLSKANFKYSEAAHVASAMNPLVNVAIYGASRSIQGRKLKVDERFVTFLKDKKIAEIRMDRNNLILGTAKKASESLIKSYKKTLEILEKYDETKDDSLLRPIEKEEINLDDAEQYFEFGNWAHPLLDSGKILDEISEDSNFNIHKFDDQNLVNKYNKAKQIYLKAMQMREESIEKAKKYEEENGERESNILKHNTLIEESQELGKKGDFEKALSLVQKAVKLIPTSQDAQWGLASCLNHLKRYRESIEAYQKLIDMQQDQDKPENPRYRFEMGQVMIFKGQTKEGLNEISKAMELTHEFDSFLSHAGKIYEELKLFDEALVAYEMYLEKFPFDYRIWISHGNCLMKIGKTKEANQSYLKAKNIKHI